MVVKLDPEHVEAVEAEGMDIAMAGTDPVDEFDPELVGRVGFADELVLVDAEQRVEQADLRNRRLADADGADRLALDQLDIEAGQGAHDARDRGGRHPARGAAADDDEAADGIADHAATSAAASAVQAPARRRNRSEEHTSELQSLMRTSYAVFCLKTKKHTQSKSIHQLHNNNYEI